MEQATTSARYFPSETTHHGQISKVDRYGWIKPDQRGELMWLNKSIIEFDEAYQRELNINKCRELASNWSWAAFGCITVAMREGRYFAVDGMHRTVASRHRSDIDVLPCIVFKSMGQEDEAAAFLRANQNRKAIRTLDSHRAAILAGDSVAKRVQRLIDTNGYTISSSNKANGIKCIGVMHKLARTKYDILADVFPLVAELCSGGMVKETVLEGLCYLQANADDQVTSPKWSKRLLQVGADELHMAAGKGAAFYAKGGARPWALGILSRINKGLQHKLQISGQAE